MLCKAIIAGASVLVLALPLYGLHKLLNVFEEHDEIQEDEETLSETISPSDFGGELNHSMF